MSLGLGAFIGLCEMEVFQPKAPQLWFCVDPLIYHPLPSHSLSSAHPIITPPSLLAAFPDPPPFFALAPTVDRYVSPVCRDSLFLPVSQCPRCWGHRSRARTSVCSVELMRLQGPRGQVTGLTSPLCPRSWCLPHSHLEGTRTSLARVGVGDRWLSLVTFLLGPRGSVKARVAELYRHHGNRAPARQPLCRQHSTRSLALPQASSQAQPQPGGCFPQALGSPTHLCLGGF